MSGISPTRILKRIVVRLLPPMLTHALRKLVSRVTAPPGNPSGSEPIEGTAMAIGAPDTLPKAADEPAAPPEWEIVPDTDAVWAALGGWDHESIVETQRLKWPSFLESMKGTGMMGRSHEGNDADVDLSTHNTIISFGYALSLACDKDRIVSVLDWGGGLGHYAVYAAALLPDQTFDFHVKDLPGLCAAGAGLMPTITFHADDSTALANSYDFVLASSAIHYARDPYAKLSELCAASRNRILVTRTPILDRGEDVLVIQRPHRYGYITEYAGWIMNRRKLVACVEACGFVLERQFLIGEQPYLPEMQEQAQYYGFLFRRG